VALIEQEEGPRGTEMIGGDCHQANGCANPHSKEAKKESGSEQNVKQCPSMLAPIGQLGTANKHLFLDENIILFTCEIKKTINNTQSESRSQQRAQSQRSCSGHPEAKRKHPGCAIAQPSMAK
jgi:hypothetical protein